MRIRNTFLFTLLFLCSLISSKAQFSGQGAGTESDPYQVTNPFELYQMSFFLNKENVYFSLMQDIDLGDWLAENFPSSGWTPLGTYDTPFKGVLRGNGKTIKNIFINRTGDYTGLFGYTNGATITDLNIYDGNVVGGQYCGMLVGYANSTTIIDNCEANGTVDASNTYVGGLCGFQNGGSLTNCRFNGNVSGTQFVGGLCGYQDGGSLTNCGFNGNVSGSGNVGGVSGKIATSTVDNCSCEGNVTGKGNYVGGIVGYTNYATITNSICKATVSGSSYVGGIAGYFDRYVKQEGKYINKCIFKGDVIGAGCVGGIVGLIFSLYPSNNYVSTNIQNDTQSRYISGCIAIGNITASGNNVGGIAGQSNHFSIDNCYFSGEITGKDYTGGIVGNLQLSVNNSFYNNYSKAKVSGTSYLGGLIGYYNSYSGSHKIQSNVAINSEIYATQSTVGLIYGGLSGTDYSQSVGSTYSNRSLSTTEVYVNDVKQTMTDNDKKNGTPTALFMLKLASSYEAWGWNFTNTWYMNSETGLPDLMWNMVVEEQTLAFSELPTMTYGNADYTLPATTDQGLTLTWTSNNANVAVVEGNILKIKGAGSATITAIQEGTNNYESFTREFPLTVKKAKLTITADDKTKDEGDENPSLTVTYSGFKYNDSESSLQSLPTLSTTATKDSGQGTYPITVEGAKSNNYSITYVGGTLTVLGKVKTAYAVYLNGTLTFYYDTKSEQKNGELYDNLTRANADDKWGAHKLDIIRVVFDSSFANATPTSTAYWFNGCTNAEEIVGLEYLNTSKVTSMYSMFNAIGKNSKKMTTLDVSGFTTGKVKNMGSMFKNNTSLTTIFVGEGWTTESVTNSTNMFSSCSKLVGGDGTKYSSSYVDKTRAYAGRGGYLSVKSQAPTVEAKEYSVYLNNTLTFYYDNNYGNRAGEVYTSLLKSSNADKWGAYKDVLSKVVFDESFKDARPTSTANWFNGCTYVEEVVGLEYLNTSEVTSMYAMFNAMGKSTKTMTVLDISGFATSKVTNMGSMFKNNSYLKTIYIGEGWTTDKVATSTNMFSGCSKLVGGDGTKYSSAYIDKTRAYAGQGGYLSAKSQALTAVPQAYAVYFDNTLTFFYDNEYDDRAGEVYTSLVKSSNTDKWGAYKDVLSKVVFDESFKDARPTSTANWFNGCTYVEEVVGLEYLNTSEVTSMYAMFNAMGKSTKTMTALDISGFATSKVTNMGSMFKNNSYLKTIYIGEGWTTDKVTTSTNMFYGCSRLVGGDGTKFLSNYTDKTRAFAGLGGYMTLLGSNAKDINDADFAATAIDDVESVATGDVYTLQGIYVGKNVDMRTLPKGIYIVGGKKVTVGF